MDKTEFRFSSGVEFRAEGGGPGKVSGVVVTYGEIALIGGMFKETFQAGAFGDVRALDVMANVQHKRDRPIGRSSERGGLMLTDSTESLEARLDLPQTRDGEDVADLMKRGILAGWSVEFEVETESEVNQGGGPVRVIEAANLVSIAIVDRPAYEGSKAQVREKAGKRKRRIWL